MQSSWFLSIYARFFSHTLLLILNAWTIHVTAAPERERKTILIRIDLSIMILQFILSLFYYRACFTCLFVYLQANNWKTNVKSVKDNMDYWSLQSTHAFLINCTECSELNWLNEVKEREKGIEKKENRKRKKNQMSAHTYWVNMK